MPASCRAVRAATRCAGLGDDLEAAALVDDLLGAGIQNGLRMSSSVTPSVLVIEMTPLRLKL